MNWSLVLEKYSFRKMGQHYIIKMFQWNALKLKKTTLTKIDVRLKFWLFNILNLTILQRWGGPKIAQYFLFVVHTWTSKHFFSHFQDWRIFFSEKIWMGLNIKTSRKFVIVFYIIRNVELCHSNNEKLTKWKRFNMCLR